jgi:GNAT superfamily N-acetyltransferase
VELRPVATDATAIDEYVALMRACFPTARHYTAEYLQWLYGDNPAGPVVGFDAWEGAQLAAHYVCVPATMELDGRPARALLSLNTATHPEHQGKGLFTKLADRTYQRGAEEGFDFVYGVANANSTPGFVRKLGFQLVAPLLARVGLGSFGIDWASATRRAVLRRLWNAESLRWRIASPANLLGVRARSADVGEAWGRTHRPGISAWAEFPCAAVEAAGPAAPLLGARLLIGLFPAGTARLGGYWEIPQSLRPSPLNLIYRPLRAQRPQVPAEEALVSFLDFDAF